MNLWRKAAYSILALLVTSMSTGMGSGGLNSASAANGSGVSLTYADVTKDAPWALEHIAEQVARGVFTGYTDGTFRPNQAITRIEAIVAAVRHIGARAEAESEDALLTKLKAKDAKMIQASYAWAVGYVAMAEKYNLLIDESAALQPGAAADRVWATTLLVRASGLAREAKAQEDAGLPFEDSDSIPVESAGYIAVANGKKLVNGYEDNTFRPAKTVSRAELAALLDRAGDAVPLAADDAFVQLDGTITNIVGGKVMIMKNGASQWFTLLDSASIIRKQQLVTSSQLQIGDEVAAVLGNTHLVHLHVTKAAAGTSTAPPDTTEQSGQTGTGTGASGGNTPTNPAPATITDGTKSGTVISRVGSTLTIRENGAAVSYALDPNVIVTRNQAAVILNEIIPGDNVTLVVSDSRIIELAAMPGQVENGRVAGTVKAVSASSLTITQSGSDHTYTVRSDAVVTINSMPGLWQSIRTGDQITALIAGGAVYHATITSASSQNSTEITGYVSAIYGNQIMLSENGRSSIYNIRTDANLFRNGADISVSELVLGDQVKVLLQEGSIFFLTVLKPYEIDPNFQIIEGTYQSHSLIGDRVRQITIATQLDGNTILRVYDIPEDTMVIGGVAGTGIGTGNPPQFTMQMQIKLTLIEEIVKLVEVIQ